MVHGLQMPMCRIHDVWQKGFNHMLVGVLNSCQLCGIAYATNDRVTMTKILVIGGGIKFDFRQLSIGPPSPSQLFHVQSSWAVSQI